VGFVTKVSIFAPTGPIRLGIGAGLGFLRSTELDNSAKKRKLTGDGQACPIILAKSPPEGEGYSPGRIFSRRRHSSKVQKSHKVHIFGKIDADLGRVWIKLSTANS
jgi:hypothetical protein